MVLYMSDCMALKSVVQQTYNAQLTDVTIAAMYKETQRIKSMFESVHVQLISSVRQQVL